MSEATVDANAPASAGGDVEHELPRVFGDYVLLHSLARGGMGEVLLAKSGGELGIDKHCVVKTLRSRFSRDPEYVERFIAEARLVVQLSHRNICPVFDVGRVGSSYYLAMELVAGRDVRALTVALEQAGRTLAPALALHIVCEMLDALDYAHRHVDPVSGEPLHVVHKDVSPQNVMINLEGEVKLIDFGLAESGRGVAQKDAGASTSSVMGKIAYMAPEHARGEPVDARADQFAAAVVAWELLAHQRYYAGLNPQQTWFQAGHGTYQPPAIIRDPELQALLARALQPQREQRYPSCRDFRQALLAYARQRGLHADAGDLRALMAQTFPQAGSELRSLLQQFAHISKVARPGFVVPKTRAEGNAFSLASSTLTNDTTATRAPAIATQVVRDRGKGERRARWPVAAAIALGAGVVFSAGLVVSRASTAPPAAPPAVSVVAPPPPAPAPAPAPASPASAAPGQSAADPNDDDARDGATAKKRTTTSRKRAFRARDMNDKLTVLKGCRRSFTCADKLLTQKEAGLDLLGPAELMRYRLQVDDCYDACTRR